MIIPFRFTPTSIPFHNGTLSIGSLLLQNNILIASKCLSANVCFDYVSVCVCFIKLIHKENCWDQWTQTVNFWLVQIANLPAVYLLAWPGQPGKPYTCDCLLLTDCVMNLHHWPMDWVLDFPRWLLYIQNELAHTVSIPSSGGVHRQCCRLCNCPLDTWNDK